MHYLKKELPDQAVSLLNVERESNRLRLFMEYMEHDLWGLMVEQSVEFSLAQIKHYMQQLLTALFKLHIRGYMHRDVKGANLLVNQKGQLKLADFGACTNYRERSTFSFTNVTLPYRAPELLLQSTNYGPEVDIWAAGCVFLELIFKKPFLHAQTEAKQLEMICAVFGTPNEQNWLGVSKLPGYARVADMQQRSAKIQSILAKCPPEVIDLASKMLELDPRKRITAEAALDHEFFFVEPLASSYTPQPFKSHNHGYTVVMAHEEKRRQTGLEPRDAKRAAPDDHNAKRQCRH
jgi:serine/threonine protein kinase